MKKSISLLIAFIVMLSVALLGCGNPTKNVKDVQAKAIKGSEDITNANQAYLRDVKKFRMETGKAIASNSQKITAYKVMADIRKEAHKYDYRQSVLELELQNSYMKMKLDTYEPKGKKKWETFKTEYTSQLLELNKEFARFSDAN